MSRGGVVAVSERRAAELLVDSRFEARNNLRRNGNALLRLLLFKLLIFSSATTNLRVGPTLNFRPIHWRQNINIMCKLLIGFSSVRQQDTFGRSSFGIIGKAPNIVGAVNVLITIEIRHRAVFQRNVEREHPEGVLQAANAPTVDFTNLLALFYQIECGGRVNVGYKPFSINLFVIVENGRRKPSVALNQLHHSSRREHRAAHLPNALNKLIGNELAATVEPPRALNERTVDLRENVERQRLSVEFHLERRARHDVAQQRVGDCLAKELVGRPREQRTAENFLVGMWQQTVFQTITNCFEHCYVAVQIVALVRELLGQRVGKMLIAIGKEIRLAANPHFIESIAVQSVPRQAQQIEITKDSIQRLPVVKAANVVETRVELHPIAAECLQTAANHGILLQHAHIQPLTRQNVGALQSAQTTSDYRNVVFHISRFNSMCINQISTFSTPVS